MDKEKFIKVFRDLELRRHEKCGRLKDRIDAAFSGYLTEAGLIVDQYNAMCKGLSLWRQKALLPPKSMAGVRAHFRERREQGLDSPLGWPESVMAKLKSASAKGRFSRLDLLSLELACALLSLYDRLWELESESFGEAAEDGFAWTLWGCYTLLGSGEPYEPLTRGELDELLMARGSSRGGFVRREYGGKNAYERETDQGIENGLADSLRRSRADAVSGTNMAVRRRSVLGSPLSVKDDLLKWTRRKMGNAKSNAATDYNVHSSSGQIKAFKKLGVDMVMIDNPMDDRTTEICRRMYGTVLKRSDCVPGITAPPFHYGCRSHLVPVVKGSPKGSFGQSLSAWMKKRKVK